MSEMEERKIFKRIIMLRSRYNAAQQMINHDIALSVTNVRFSLFCIFIIMIIHDCLFSGSIMKKKCRQTKKPRKCGLRRVVKREKGRETVVGNKIKKEKTYGDKMLISIYGGMRSIAPLRWKKGKEGKRPRPV